MIEVKNLYKGYGKKPVLKNISLQVQKGSIHGLIGRNGSGKTTLIKCLTGIYKQDQGSLRVCGEEIYDNPDVKARIGYVADRNEYFSNYRIYEMVDLYEELYPDFSRSDFDDYNEAMNLDDRMLIKQLSKGQKMRLAIILNLSIHPDILILDEPTEGLDVIAKRQVMDFMIREVEEREMTVFITSHHLEELENFCDSITMIRDGKITGCGSVDEMKETVTKIQIVMKKGLPHGFDQWKGVLHYSNVGSIYTIVWKHFDEDKKEALRLAGAELIEEIPISLEEIFLYENRGQEAE
ncbi:MAG: ABC transporter ATP-binding protein [Lachnospiraceae bacterium]|nr:ABC transporter ATP-binding protein [Lachnospiraceae bacterium]